MFVRGALVAKDPESYGRVPGLTRVEREALKSESASSFWSQIRLLTKEERIILVTCCIAAVVQYEMRTLPFPSVINMPR